MLRETIRAEQLMKLIGSPSLAIFDASWYMPAEGRNTGREFLDAHIPGSLFFDIDRHSELGSDLPHMLPDKDTFQANLRNLGLRQGQDVIVYDTAGLFSAARVWWMLRSFGVPSVAVLEGGLPAWRAAGGAIETGEPEVGPGDVLLSLDANALADIEYMKAAVARKSEIIVDARSVARFSGAAPDPRQGVEPGHMPGSRNVPFPEVLTSDGCLKDTEELHRVFERAGVPFDSAVITSCGSGVTAAILTLALTRLGKKDLRLYDGSWAEWGSRPETPKAVAVQDPAPGK